MCSPKTQIYLANKRPGTLNELFLTFHHNVHDDTPKWVQALEEIATEEVLKERDCVFTSASYDVFGLKEANRNARCPARFKDKLQIKQWIFDQGTLICRWVYTQEREGKKSSYGGEVRRLYRRETTDFTPAGSSDLSSTPVNTSPAKAAPAIAPKRERGESMELVETPPKRFQQLPSKTKPYTMGDVFCGIGGTSEGARSAGLHVSFGLENDPDAMQAYQKNVPHALHLEMDAHDFPVIVRRYIHGVDLCHFSCPCQFFSINQ